MKMMSNSRLGHLVDCLLTAFGEIGGDAEAGQRFVEDLAVDRRVVDREHAQAGKIR